MDSKGSKKIDFLNYKEKILIAEEQLLNGNYDASVITCVSILENLFKNLYFSIKNLAGSHLEKVFHRYELNQYKSIGCDDVLNFTFGQLIHAYKDKNLNLYNMINKFMEKKITITKSIDISLMNRIRKKCSHLDGVNFSSQIEANFVFYSTKLIFEDLGYYKENKCLHCKTVYKNNQNFCLKCGKSLKTRCPECENIIENRSEICGKCGKEIYILSDKEVEALQDGKRYFSKVYNKCMPCPICGKNSDICGVDYDEESGVVEDEYEYMCNCEFEIDYIFKYMVIKNSLRYRFQKFIDSKTNTERPTHYYLKLFQSYGNFPIDRFE